MLLANPCGKIADLAFDAGSLGVLDAWYGAAAYAFQIYFDFSGYSDMAIGLGLMFGFMFAKNFDSPYRAQSITEFWHRWHISLSTWLRDYLYVPLGGNRKGPARTYVNLFIVMLLGGLWHGAAWNFVIWGGLHGAMLAARALARQGRALRRAARRRCASPPRSRSCWSPGCSSARPICRTRCVTSATCWRSARRRPGAGLLAGIVYGPYYLGTFLLAGVIVWTAPQTWDWTRTLTLPKAAATSRCWSLARSSC